MENLPCVRLSQYDYGHLVAIERPSADSPYTGLVIGRGDDDRYVIRLLAAHAGSNLVISAYPEEIMAKIQPGETPQSLVSLKFRYPPGSRLAHRGHELISIAYNDTLCKLEVLDLATGETSHIGRSALQRNVPRSRRFGQR